MFNRKVLASNGTVYSYHEAVRIRHDIKADLSFVDVESRVADGQEVARSNTYGHLLDTSMTFEQAEEWLRTLDEFEEYIDEAQAALDEVLDILTDDQAPVELLGMRAIDGLIREEIGYYQNIYREQGITGLMDAF